MPEQRRDQSNILGMHDGDVRRGAIAERVGVDRCTKGRTRVSFDVVCKGAATQRRGIARDPEGRDRGWSLVSFRGQEHGPIDR